MTERNAAARSAALTKTYHERISMKRFLIDKHFLRNAGIILMLLCALLAFSACDGAIEYAVISENNTSSDGYIYTLYENNTAVITGIKNPEQKVLRIPEKVDSYQVTSIAQGAFEGNTFIQYLSIPKGVTTISQSAFRKCYGLLRVDLSETVTTIGDFAFDSCEKLCEVNGLTGVKTIGSSAFFQCISLSVFDFPAGLKTIGEQAFYGCSVLTTVRLPQKIESVGFGAFAQCKTLTKIDLGGLKVVADAMFERAESLLEVNIGNSVERIGERAFRGSRNLESVTISKNVAYIGSAAFENTQWLSKQKDEFFVVGKGVLLKYNGKSAEVVLPKNIKVIADAFNSSSKLESITIGNNVTAIAEYAFNGCLNLKTVILEGKIETIGNCAFLGCTALETITLPKTLKSVGDNAFSGCSSLKTVIYMGKSDAWYAIPVGKGNQYLQTAEMVFR